jgi:hypothetical protein
MVRNRRPEGSQPCPFLRRALLAAAPILLTVHVFGCDGEAEPVRLAASPADNAPAKRRDSAQEKIDRIVENGSKSPVPPLTTRFSEDEVNRLLRVHIKELDANGLSDPQVRLIGNNTLVARIIVDLDEYKRRRQGRGALGPLALITGRLPVSARGLLHTRDGQGQFKLERADVNGIPVPPALVREMVTVLSRSQRNPEGYDIEQPFALPANIRTVTIHPKEAMITQ